MNVYINLLVDIAPFVLYTALLGKLALVWRRISSRLHHAERRVCDCKVGGERRATNLLLAILILLTVCTLTFMASNAYALMVFETTLLSMRVFQMFVVGNCAAYWLVLDLVSRDATVVSPVD